MRHGSTASLQVSCRRETIVYYKLTLVLPGGASRRQQIVNEWKLSSAAVLFLQDCMDPSQQTADEITDSADDKLFDCVLCNNDHVLHELLSALTSHITCEHVVMTERFRRRRDKNFITRMLYKNAY